ncbi:ArgS-related anticodon-binding protein NrtL [Streptomyces sp. NBC_00582]|uniref:ArgS-related anticodon-binding protein NrtL n=1 Tax=Streptomyces sp. NBC_00582 TaxID=2975783 RepID=UPI002E810B78|nr:DALR anticodon-binding domain-containing protein [Streptomyces sp. NBC_00582]WUB61953.1 DALR anticodon-binding domain-containing protein [Streptomyces sp. NBC_00582]
MTPVELSRTVLHAVRRAVDAGELSVAVPARAVVGPPGPGGAGDYATNIALQLARPAGQPALRVAEVLRTHLAGADGITRVEITGPGFLNISLDHGTAATGLVGRIHREGPRYGHGDTLAGQVYELRVPFEVRAEVLADALARIVASQGGRVATRHRDPGDIDKPPKGIGPEPFELRPRPAPEDPTPLGLDAACWALLHPAPHDCPRITADHLVQRESNPLFRVRYAHARTRALSRNAADLGFSAEPGPVDPSGNPEPAQLLPLLADYPRVLATVAALPRPEGVAAPSRLARHLVGVADATLLLLPLVLPLGEEKPSAAHRARLALAEAAGTVLAGGLSLLGIDAPDHL